MPSKLCPHAFAPSAALRRLAAAGAPALKLAGALELAAEVRPLNPAALLVGQALEAFDLDAEAAQGRAPEAVARAWLEQQQALVQAHPLIQAWEGPPPPALGSATEPAAMRRMAWYAAFEVERLRLLAELGLRGVVGNFPAGGPDLPLWAAFLPALDAAERQQGLLGLHEYGSPFMWSLTGRYQVDGSDEGDTGWTTLRYRKVYRQYLAPNGLGALPLLIGECGLGPVGLVAPGQTDGAWREQLAGWDRHTGADDPIAYWRGPERDPERYYAEQLLWYDRELQQDAYVIGAAVFTLGAAGPWSAFEIEGSRVAEALVQHVEASRTAPAPRVPPRATVVPPNPAPPAAPQTSRHQVPPGPELTRPARSGGNLLVNAGFEDGHVHFADDTRERAVPAGWQLTYADAAEPLEPGQSGPFGQPITLLINSQGVPAADRGRVFAGGAYAWKVCGGRAPFRARLAQTAAGLTPGARYQFTVNVLPEVLVRAQPRPVYAAEPLASELRLTAGAADSGWKPGPLTPYGRYNRLSLEFTAEAAEVAVAVEVRCRYPLPLAAWYFDELSLLPA